MRPKQIEAEMRRNLFTDLEDLHSRHPGIAEHLEAASVLVMEAHTHPPGSQAWAVCLVRAEREALAANAALAPLLGSGVDTAALLVLVRLAIEAMAHAGRAAPA